MHTIIISDIFGKTKALDEIAASFSNDVEILDPYNAQIMDFSDEAEACVQFMKELSAI
jgi:stage III sporulation protein SpoIIIAA